MKEDAEGFIKSLFFGNIREDMVFPFPRLEPEVAETVAMMQEAVGKFASEHIDSVKWDEDAAMPREIVDKVSELGLMGLLVEERHNGLGLPMMAYGHIFEKLATYDSALTVTVGAHQSIGYKALLLYGNEDQRERFLPRLATGELIAAFCLTEPSSGSDAASIQTKAVLSDDGKYYTVNGSKIWITNGGIATFLTVFAKVEVEDKGEKKEKVTCFVLEIPTEGVTVGPSEKKMGIKASWTNEIHLDNVKIPVENIVGEAGKGFKVAMGILNHGRLGLAAGCVGGIKNCIKAAVEHATERRQFQKKLIEFGMIQDKIAQMTIDLYAAESMVYLTTHLIDRGDVDYYLESAAAKIFATEALWNAIDENIQIWGGNGFMKEYPFEMWLRDARIFRIFEGTNEVLRAFIALSGMQGPGEELAGLAEAIKHPLKGLGPVSDFAIKRIKRSVMGESIENAHPALKKMAGVIEEETVEFAGHVENILRKHGKKVFLMQFAQKRLANVAIDLFGLTSVLARTTGLIEERGVEKCELEMELAEGYLQQAKRRIRASLDEMSKNEDELRKSIANTVAEAGSYPVKLIGL
jgi:acyl-CoA dehydrogenase family protein 9